MNPLSGNYLLLSFSNSITSACHSIRVLNPSIYQLFHSPLTFHFLPSLSSFSSKNLLKIIFPLKKVGMILIEMTLCYIVM